MDFFRKKLRELFAGKEHGTGLVMAGVLLVAAIICGRSVGMWEAASGRAAGVQTRLVIIDAGHGGDDPGKIGVDGTEEKDLNLKMALSLREMLEQQDVTFFHDLALAAQQAMEADAEKAMRIFCGL